MGGPHASTQESPPPPARDVMQQKDTPPPMGPVEGEGGHSWVAAWGPKVILLQHHLLGLFPKNNRNRSIDGGRQNPLIPPSIYPSSNPYTSSIPLIYSYPPSSIAHLSGQLLIYPSIPPFLI
jgi:hypothetical protein